MSPESLIIYFKKKYIFHVENKSLSWIGRDPQGFVGFLAL